MAPTVTTTTVSTTARTATAVLTMSQTLSPTRIAGDLNLRNVTFRTFIDLRSPTDSAGSEARGCSLGTSAK